MSVFLFFCANISGNVAAIGSDLLVVSDCRSSPLQVGDLLVGDAKES